MTDGIDMRPLQEAEVPAAHALSSAVGWRHRPEDWSFLLRLGRGIGAHAGGSLIGTTVWWPFGPRFARIGMVIVAPDRQGRGLGGRMMQAAMDAVGDRSILLSASRQGLPLYEKLGFVEIGRVRQHQAEGATPRLGTPPDGSRIRPVRPSDLPALLTLDERALGFARPALLTALADVGEGWILERRAEIAAWCYVRRFGRGSVIGPVWASDAACAEHLVATVIARHREQFLRIDTLAASGLSAWVQEQGLPCVGEEVAMVRGTAPDAATGPARSYALTIAGLG